MLVVQISVDLGTPLLLKHYISFEWASLEENLIIAKSSVSDVNAAASILLNPPSLLNTGKRNGR